MNETNPLHLEAIPADPDGRDRVPQDEFEKRLASAAAASGVELFSVRDDRDDGPEVSASEDSARIDPDRLLQLVDAVTLNAEGAAPNDVQGDLFSTADYAAAQDHPLHGDMVRSPIEVAFQSAANPIRRVTNR